MIALVWIALVLSGAGCSPYIYKSEITGFSSGVSQLGEAYQAGLAGAAGDRLERQRIQWTAARAGLALTEGCVPQAAGGADGGVPCAVHQAGQAPPEPSPVVVQALRARPIVSALREYADALAAVTNAEDQQALEAAQARFSGSVEDLLKEATSGTSPVGPVAELASSVLTATLNARRYHVLRQGVLAADDPVAVLGSAMGETLEALRAARANELRRTANVLLDGLGPGLGYGDYAARLDTVQEKAAAIEALRQVDPSRAAGDMVAAHRELARALRDDSRQLKPVAQAVRDFVARAKAVRGAFGG